MYCAPNGTSRVQRQNQVGVALEEAALGVDIDPTTTPLSSTASDQEFASKHRTGVAVPRKNTVPQNRYDGKTDEPLATGQIRS